MPCGERKRALERYGTVGKALEVLDQVAGHGRPVRFSELLEGSRFPKATLYRFLQSLAGQGMLAYDAERQTYMPGLRLVRLAHAAWQHSSLAPIARPHVDALAEVVREAVHLAQIDHGHVIFVDKRKKTNMFDTLAQTGLIAPSYCTGVGKAILAFLPEETRSEALKMQAFVPYTPHTHRSPKSLWPELDQIRDEGIAFDREEHEQGIISVAAPIIPDQRRVVGAISIATSTSRRSLDELRTLSPTLRETASRIAAEVQPWQFPN